MQKENVSNRKLDLMIQRIFIFFFFNNFQIYYGFLHGLSMFKLQNISKDIAL